MFLRGSLRSFVNNEPPAREWREFARARRPSLQTLHRPVRGGSLEPSAARGEAACRAVNRMRSHVACFPSIPRMSPVTAARGLAGKKEGQFYKLNSL